MRRTARHTAHRVAASAALALAALFPQPALLGGCEEPQVEPDGALGDAAVDAAADSGLPPVSLAPRQPVALDICARPFFRIPCAPEDLLYYTLADRRVAWEVDAEEPGYSDLWLLDLSVCEATLAVEKRTIGLFDLWRNTLVWEDARWPVWDDELNKAVGITNLAIADLDRWDAKWLFYSETSSFYAQVNDDYVAFVHKVDRRETGLHELWLLSRDTGEATVVAPTNVAAIWPSMGERYLGYVGYYPQGGEGFDVYYYDTWTGQTNWLEATGAGYQEGLQHVGDYLAWFHFPPSLQPPYRVDAYHIPTETLINVTDNEYESPMGALDPPVVAYSTTAHDPPEGRYWDVSIYDLESGARRRLTWQAGTLHPVRLSMPYLLLVHLLSPHVNGGPKNLYIANLEALGVVDPHGHVIAGDPVIEQPSSPLEIRQPSIP